jgi:hypothetical protein
MKNIFSLIGMISLCAFLAFAQSTTTNTTLCAAMTASATTACLTSTTGVVNQTGLYIDGEYMVVNLSNTQTVATGPAYVPVARAVRFGSGAAAHNNSSPVWVALTPSQTTYPGDNGFEMGNAASTLSFFLGAPCTRSNYAYMPRIIPGRGLIRDCNASTAQWVDYSQERTLFVGPGNCAWSTTGTTTGTNGLATIGASVVPVNQVQVSNAGASANTFQCWLGGDIYQALVNRGVTITSFDVIYGVQTTTLTSINGAAVATVTFPAPAATETASTVTPVAVGGTLTTSSTTGNMAATTAGAFKNIRTTLGTPFNPTTDITAVLFTLVFNQSASAAQIVQSPGMLIHYTQAP